MERIVKFYFTGTDTTKKIVSTVAKEISELSGGVEIVDYNFTLPKSREADPIFGEGDLVIAGVPTIAGRVPNLLLKYLERLKGQGALAVPIALYGNRNFDDCLMELAMILENSGMDVIAGGAFIGEHSFSKILAANRPDDKDLEKAEEFGREIYEKISRGDFSKPKLEGCIPLRKYYTPRDRYGNGIDIRKVKPKTDMDKCIDCKICAEVCPLGSIDYEEVWKVPGICMKCCACIKKCPTDAKYFDDEGYLYHAHELEELYEARKEPVYFV